MASKTPKTHVHAARFQRETKETKPSLNRPRTPSRGRLLRPYVVTWVPFRNENGTAVHRLAADTFADAISGNSRS